MEKIVNKFDNSHLIRVNLQYPQVPKEIIDKSLTFKIRAIDFINSLWKKKDLDSK